MFDRFSMNVGADNIDATSCERIVSKSSVPQPTSRTFGFFSVRRIEYAQARRFRGAYNVSGISEKSPFRVEAANDMACVPDYRLSFLSVNHRSAQPSAGLRRRSGIVVA